MAGEPAPLAAVQAAVLKSAASKKAQSGDTSQAGASPNTAIAQDLAVMADQAKGYTAGVDQGVIVAQDNRAAAARRLAEERAAADAARQRELALEQMQTQQMQLQGQAAAQSGRFQIEEQSARLAEQRRKEAEEEDEPDVENAYKVRIHAMSNQPSEFQDAFSAIIADATKPTEAIAIFDNARRNDEEWTEDVDRNLIWKYAKEYFDALKGNAVDLKSLEPKRKMPAPPRMPVREPERNTDTRSPLVGATTEGSYFRVPGTDYKITAPSWLWG